MKLRTELKQAAIQHLDAILYVQQMSTTALTEIALQNKRGDGTDAMRATFVNSIVAWDGITDEEGNALECSEANRRAVFEANPSFVEAVLPKIHETLDTALEVEKKI